MDCRKFDGQVVRLEGIKHLADQFVRVRLTRVEDADLSLFQFDLDLTFAVFFLNADETIYGRYGGRDADSPDARQSLAGLRFAMQAALDGHKTRDTTTSTKQRSKPILIRKYAGRRFSGCIHCHQAKEILNDDLKKNGKWSRELLWRFPPPDNLGFVLEVDRGNVVKRVEPGSAAANSGLKPEDVVQSLNGVPVHSFADAQYALDLAPTKGSIDISWRRDDDELMGKLELPVGWRRTNVSWRASMMDMVPSARLYGDELTAEEKKTIGLSAKQLAFRQKQKVHAQAKAAGIQPGDIILGLDNKTLEMDAYDFLRYVREHYIVGDRATVNIIRNRKRVDLQMTLQPF